MLTGEITFSEVSYSLVMEEPDSRAHLKELLEMYRQHLDTCNRGACRRCHEATVLVRVYAAQLAQLGG